MSEIIIEKVNDFIEAILSIKRNDETELFFRGHADYEYPALPTIFRNKEHLKNEKHLFNDIITQCPEEFKDCQYTFEYLVKMQHYGLSTRLLDITSNALVALYFSCCSLNDFMCDGKGNIVCDKDGKEIDQCKDGQVLVYRVQKNAIKNYNSDTVSVLANLAHLDSVFNVFTKDDAKELGKFQLLKDQLNNELDILKKELSRLEKECLALKIKMTKDKEHFVNKKINALQEELSLLNKNMANILQEYQRKETIKKEIDLQIQPIIKNYASNDKNKSYLPPMTKIENQELDLEEKLITIKEGCKKILEKIYKEVDITKKNMEKELQLLLQQSRQYLSKNKEDIEKSNHRKKEIEEEKEAIRLALDKLEALQRSKQKFLDFIKQEKSYFVDKIDSEKDVQKIVCVRAKLNNPRIVRQSGLFFLFGMGNTKGEPITFSEYINELTSKARNKQNDNDFPIQEITTPKILISGRAKKEIIKELRTLGISEDTLMPEMETVAKSIKGRYSH